jgi:hypothetical protein
MRSRSPPRREGAGSRWRPDTFNIFPNTQAEATIAVAPPRNSLHRGPFNFEIAVMRTDSQHSSMVYQGSVEIGAIQPEGGGGGRGGHWHDVHNRSAATATSCRSRSSIWEPANQVQVSAAELCRRTVALSSPTFAWSHGAEKHRPGRLIKPRSGFMSGRREHVSVHHVSPAILTSTDHRRRMDSWRDFIRKRVIGAGSRRLLLIFAAGSRWLPRFAGPGPMASPTAIASGSP